MSKKPTEMEKSMDCDLPKCFPCVGGGNGRGRNCRTIGNGG